MRDRVVCQQLEGPSDDVPVKRRRKPLPAPGGPEFGQACAAVAPWCLGGAGPTCSVPPPGVDLLPSLHLPPHSPSHTRHWDIWECAGIKQGCAHRPLAAEEEVAVTQLASRGPRLRPARGRHLATESLLWCSARPRLCPRHGPSLYGALAPDTCLPGSLDQAMAGTLGWLHAQVSPMTMRGQSCQLPAHWSVSAASRPAG